MWWGETPSSPLSNEASKASIFLLRPRSPGMLAALAPPLGSQGSTESHPTNHVASDSGGDSGPGFRQQRRIACMKTLTKLTVCLALLVVVAAGHAATKPFSFPRSTPESQGVSSTTLLALVVALDQIDAMNSLMLVRHGRVIAEGWWAPYSAVDNHELYSLSKSFTSTAVGMAVAEGKLSIDDEVLKFFPDDAPANPSANLKAMRVRDLLTMSTGNQDEIPTPPTRFRRRRSSRTRCRTSREPTSNTTRPRRSCAQPSCRS